MRPQIDHGSASSQAAVSAPMARSSGSGCAKRARRRCVPPQDRGACFSAETCAPERDLYNTQIEDAGVNLLSFVAPGVVVLIADPQ